MIHPSAPESLYRIVDADRLLTPSLVIYPELVDANIAATVKALDGDANRWRPHIKTAKLSFIMRRMVEAGVKHCKCSTTLELQTAIEAGFSDALVAYPMVGTSAERVRDLAAAHPQAKVSVLVENALELQEWQGSQVGLFIDVNPGMNRTGIEQGRVDEIAQLAASIHSSRLEFRGLHYYDGQVATGSLEERQQIAQDGYNRLLEIVFAVERTGVPVPEVITSGTPAFPASASYWPFTGNSFVHRASPGTVVYNDCTSLEQLPDFGYQAAALVVSTVVSHPAANIATCNAGHKSVSADAGTPTCAVAGHPGLYPRKPSEEHLPIEAFDEPRPAIGNLLYLIPRHVCPTVNNFDHAVIVEKGAIQGIEPVTARGHERPLL